MKERWFLVGADRGSQPRPDNKLKPVREDKCPLQTSRPLKGGGWIMVAPTDVRSDWPGVWRETLVWLNTRDTSVLGSSIETLRGWWNGMPYIYPLSALFLRTPSSVCLR
jgi:hypothetical protein